MTGLHCDGDTRLIDEQESVGDPLQPTLFVAIAAGWLVAFFQNTRLRGLWTDITPRPFWQDVDKDEDADNGDDNEYEDDYVDDDHDEHYDHAVDNDRMHVSVVFIELKL